MGLKEETRLEEYFSQAIAEIDQGTARYGLLNKYGVDSIDKILDNPDTTYFSGDSTEESRVYKLLNQKFNLLDTWGSRQYKLDTDREVLETFKERLEQHLDRGYDRVELVALLRNEYSELGELPTQRHFREQDHLPSELPYKSRFGDWNSALYMAGLDPEETGAEKEELEHELIKKTHEMNEDTDFLLKTPSAREINEDESMHTEAQYRHHFGSIEEAFSEAGLGNIRAMERQHVKWNEIVFKPYSGQLMDDYSDLDHLYPALLD